MGSCIPDDRSRPVLFTTVDTNCLQSLAQFNDWTNVEISQDAGRYLCEFIFYRSLYECTLRKLDTPVLFIHVPPPSPTYTKEQIRETLQCLVHGLCVQSVIQRKGWRSKLFAFYLKSKRSILGKSNKVL